MNYILQRFRLPATRDGRAWIRGIGILPVRNGLPTWRRDERAGRELAQRVYRFLVQRGAPTSLQAAFPQLRSEHLGELLCRYRRIQRRKAERYKCRLE